MNADTTTQPTSLRHLSSSTIVVEQTYKYRAYPTADVANDARRHIDICRQVYNHALGLYNAAPADEKPSYTTLQNKLPAWKRAWSAWTTVNAKCLQMAVRRIYASLSVLNSLKSKGYTVGRLKWKSPRAYRSIVFNQSGFDVDSNTGRTDHATLTLSKLGPMDLDYHRSLPADGTIKQVILKEEKSGKWHASIVVDRDPSYPEKPPVESITPADTVGIDLGILTFTHDSDGTAVTPLDETRDRARIEHRHRALSRKQYDSNNWEISRQNLAAAYERLSNKRTDFREKLAHSYTTQYDAVFLEDLNVRGMLEQEKNGRNVAAMSWRETIQAFERHGKKNGCHIKTVPPEGTTKRCAKCGVESAKSLWVREHSCPACRFEADRDRNAAFEVQKLGLDELGIDYAVEELLGLGESEATPAETALPTDTTQVSAQRVIETGSHGPPDPW
jgi:putative transposase